MWAWGMRADWGSPRGLPVPFCQLERWRAGKSALLARVRKCFVSTVARRGVIIIRNNKELVSGQGLRSGGPGTQVDRLLAESLFPKNTQ